MNADKLARLQSSVRIGGKGTPRRKVKKVHKTSAAENVKLQSALKKLGAQSIPAIEEVNMFKEDGQVIHFGQPKGIMRVVTCNSFGCSSSCYWIKYLYYRWTGRRKR